MSIKENINKDLKMAMKEKNRDDMNILRVLKGEIARHEDGSNQMSDAQISSLISKFCKNLESINDERSKREMEILKFYLPEPMTEEEIQALIDDICLNFTEPLTMKNMGSIMSQFKEQCSGQADNRIVSQLVKSKINA